MKKILIVTDFYKPHISGITSFIESISNIYVKNRVRIIILTACHDLKLKRIERINRTIIIRSKILLKISRGHYSFSLIKDFLFLSKRVDIVNFHFPLAEIFPLCLLTKKTKITNYHCLPPRIGINLQSIFNIYFSIVSILSLWMSDKIIVFSNDYFSSIPFSNYFKNKVYEIPPAVKQRISIKVNENVLRNNEIPIIGFLGRICAEKGLKDLIKSSKVLKENNFNHNLLIAGNLDDKRFKKYILHIKKLAKGHSNIKFLGLLNEREKNNFFNKINILILPSINSYEAFGIVQLEAMSYGKLVIASDLKGVRVPVNLTNNGLIIKDINSQQIAKKIIECTELAKIKTKKEVIDSLSIYSNELNFEKNYLNLINKIN